MIDAPKKVYLAGNLKREKERTIARYLDSFFSQIRDSQAGSSSQDDPGKESDAAKENTAVKESSKKEATGIKIAQSNKLRNVDNTVIKLTTFDYPGTSKSHQPGKKPSTKPGHSKVKSTQSKATQMRENLSTQRLQANEEIDDDSSLDAEDTQARPKYILVGWDKFRSKLMLILLILFVLWAVIYFPIILNI